MLCNLLLICNVKCEKVGAAVPETSLHSTVHQAYCLKGCTYANPLLYEPHDAEECT